MEGVEKYRHLEEIPSAKYEGYIWMSNEDKPTILNKEDFSKRDLSLNPFIVEALLFDDENQKSIHITHDGNYNITMVALNTYVKPLFEVIDKEYLPHRLEGIKKVCFKQIWKEEYNDNITEFPVLTLQATVFCGFKK